MKNYTIEVKEYIEKPKKKEQPRKSSDSSLLILVFAIIVGIMISPDLIDIRNYIPRDKYENTNRF